MVYAPLILEESNNISEQRIIELSLEESYIFNSLTESVEVLDIIQEGKVGEFFGTIIGKIKKAFEWLKKQFLLLVKKIKGLITGLFKKAPTNENSINDKALQNKYSRFNAYDYISNNDVNKCANAAIKGLEFIKNSTNNTNTFSEIFINHDDETKFLDSIYNKLGIADDMLLIDIDMGANYSSGERSKFNNPTEYSQKIRNEIESNLDKLSNNKSKSKILKNIKDNKNAQNVLTNLSNNIIKVLSEYDKLIGEWENRKGSFFELGKKFEYKGDFIIGAKRYFKTIISESTYFKSVYMVSLVLTDFCVKCIKSTISNDESDDNLNDTAKKYDNDVAYAN